MTRNAPPWWSHPLCVAIISIAITGLVAVVPPILHLASKVIGGLVKLL